MCGRIPDASIAEQVAQVSLTGQQLSHRFPVTFLMLDIRAGQGRVSPIYPDSCALQPLGDGRFGQFYDQTHRRPDG
ncbi:hypothetical protein Afe04nite_42610 [Asanoa ferruginea]|nr:hypothetical protein Afe04nite_42610 [Asanoa ferruginea]